MHLIKITFELHNLEILKSKKENKNPESSNSEIFYLIKFSSYLTRFFYFHFFIVKFPSYEKLAMTSQFDLARFYDVMRRNSIFSTQFFNSEIPDPSEYPQKTNFKNSLLLDNVAI